MTLKFKEGVKSIYTSELWYDVFEGGYIQPEEFLEADDAEKVKDAIKLLNQFVDEAIENDFIEIG